MYIKLETRHNNEKIIINEIYFKDNIILINNYENNILQTTDWKNTITGEKISYIYTLDEGILESNSFNDTLIEKIKSVVSIDNSNTSFLKYSFPYFINAIFKYFPLPIYLSSSIGHLQLLFPIYFLPLIKLVISYT